MHAVRIYETGGPEQMLYEETELPSPGSGQVLVKVAAAGLNFIDVYHRTGLYPLPKPFTPGLEIAGTVAAVGKGVEGFAEGDLVASARASGGYADYALAPATQLVRVPENLELRKAAAAMLQGMTAHYLCYSTYPLKAGETALVHAAAGGVGLLLVQMAKQIGARVIGTAGSEAKAQLAHAAGADEVIIYTQQDFVEAARNFSGGQGVDVVYDSVGVDTFERSLNCLRPRGYMVLFGQSSGPVPPIDLQTLNAKGSLFVTRPTLFHYIATPEDLAWRAGDIFQWMADDKLDVRIGSTFKLSQAGEAHRALEGRRTTGKVLLIPD